MLKDHETLKKHKCAGYGSYPIRMYWCKGLKSDNLAKITNCSSNTLGEEQLD